MSTKVVSKFISSIQFENLPPEIVMQAKRCTLDTIGGAIAGRNTKTARVVENIVRSAGGMPEATVIGSGTKFPVDKATLVNSTMCTVLDSDDGCMSPVGHLGHIGGCVIPAALGMAEHQNSSGKTFIEGVVAGYEIYLRTSLMWVKAEGKTFRAGTIGTHGAAAASAKLLKLSPEQIQNALGIAEYYTPIPKVGRIANTGPMAKEAMPWGALTGLSAALLARQGFIGPVVSYDEPSYDHSCLEGLGSNFEMGKIYFKPYCACRYTHAALDIILDMKREHTFLPKDIKNIVIEVSSRASLLNTTRPMSIEHAEYSFPFVIGAILVDGEVSPHQIREDRLNDKLILGLADKVRIEINKSIDDLFPCKFGAIVTIETNNNKKYQGRRDFPRGDPEDPLSNEELQEKFRKWALTSLDTQRVEKLLVSIWNLENLGNVNELLHLLSYF